MRSPTAGRLLWEAVPLTFLAVVAVWIGRQQSRAGSSLFLTDCGCHGSSSPAGWILLALLMAALVGGGLVAALRSRRTWPIRVPYLVLVVIMFMQLFMVPPVQADRAMTPAETAEMAMLVVATRINMLSSDGRLPTEPRRIRGVTAGLPALVGRPGTYWSLETRVCSSPADLPASLAEGIAIYCVSPDADRGWLAWSERRHASRGGGSAAGAAAELRRLELKPAR